MHWSSEPFASLHAFAAAGRNTEFVSKATELAPDLLNLLGAPAKSEASRQSLATRRLTVEGTAYELNSEFLDAAAQVADELNVDELVSAQLVLWSQPDALGLHISALEAAVTLWYVRRQYIIDIVRFVALHAREWSGLAKIVIGEDGVSHLAAALEAVERTLEDLGTKSKRGEFLGLGPDSEFVHLLGLQRDFLVKEHENLGAALFLICTYHQTKLAPVTRLLQRAQSDITVYDTRVIAYFFPAVAFFLRGSSSATEPYTTWGRVSSPSQWKLPWLGAALQLVTAARAATAASSAQEYSAILNTAREAIDAGAIEGLMALAHDLSPARDPSDDNFGGVVRARVPHFAPWGISVDPAVLISVFEALDWVMEAVVGGLADLLREMRLNEEDTHLALAATTSETANLAQTPGEDLERFFLAVAFTYRTQSAAHWWIDTAGPLYGFMTWAAGCQATFMSATAAEMLASLAVSNAEAASQFLEDGNENVEKWSLSWRGLASALTYYVTGLSEESPSQGPSATTKTLDDDSVVVIQAYLRLVREVCGPYRDARTKFSPQIKQLFTLLKLCPPLCSSILRCLASLAVDAAAAAEIWPLLDMWIIPSSRPRFDECLQSSADVLALVELLYVLVEHPPPEGVDLIDDYATFALKEALVWASKMEAIWTQPVQLAVVGVAKRLVHRPRILELCFERPVAHALFAIAGFGVDSIVGLPPQNVAVRLVTATLELISALVAASTPQCKYTALVLYNLSIVPHISLYAGTSHVPLALVSLRLLGQLARSSEFSSGHPSRLLTIFASVTESGRIRLALARQLREAEPSVQRALLEFLAADLLETSHQEPAVAHQLLGFTFGTLGGSELTLDSGVGGVAAGGSLLAAVCACLYGSLCQFLPEPDATTARIVRLSAQVLASLVKDRRTSDEVLGWLRPQSYLPELAGAEPFLSRSTLASLPNDIVTDFYTHRALVQDILVEEIRECASQGLLSLVQRYVKILMHTPGRSTLDFLDFLHTSTPETRQTRLDALRAWSRFVPALLKSEPSPGFVLEAIRTLVPLLSQFARRDPEFCRPIASLLVLLQSRTTEKSAMATDRLHALLIAALDSIQPTAAFLDVRTDLYLVCSRALPSHGSLRDISRHGGERLLRTAADDVIRGAHQRLRVRALMFLQVCAAQARKSSSPVSKSSSLDDGTLESVVDALVRCNHVSLLTSMVSRTAGDERKMLLSLLLELAQSRAGAQHLLTAQIFVAADALLPLLRSHGSDLVLTVQLVTAVVLAMGAADKQVLSSARELLHRHEPLILAVLRADASSPALTAAPSDAPIAVLARAVTALLAVTGYQPAPQVDVAPPELHYRVTLDS